MGKQHKETLNFGPFAGYYGAMSGEDGYGGLNYSGLVEYLNAIYWENIATYWCETGYQNVAAATGASSIGYVYDYGTFSSAGSPKETFDLKSFVESAAWSANMKWTLTTYRGGTEVGAMIFYASDAPGTTAVKLKVPTSIGSHITSFALLMDDIGTGGNSCGGYGTPVEGYQLAFGDMKIVWNGKIPVGHGTSNHTSHQHHVSPAPLIAHQLDPFTGTVHRPDAHHDAAPWHTELLALAHDPGSLTSQFALPQVEHLGA